ncbi:unnamed protein product [Coffea canephora]|uniref:F-box domain-containing protein n=1 Tax=Coffea canephora TaxID=49390 RepID=A0A068TRS2_COFCA|nr:unnamed protein product [Coffea canephora]
MGLHQKFTRTTATKDFLGVLPDGILSKIISRLTLKEAVRTSILSKSWRAIWTSHPCLLFDSASILGNKIHSKSMSCCFGEPDRQLQRLHFVEKVDHLMHQRRRGLRIDSLAIYFHLGKEFASHISEWIECAFAKGAEIIDLDLSESCSFKVDNVPLAEFERYTFSCSLLASPNVRCTLKHLRLTCCNFDSVPTPGSLASLTTAELRDVNISDQQLENFLLTCLRLENLSLLACTNLVKLKFSCPKFRLKILSIQNCPRLDSIELGPESLTTFEYTGELATFSFKYAPRLTDMYLSFTGHNRQDGVSSALSRFACDIPHLRTLNLVSVLGMKTPELPDKVLNFTNVQELILTVFPFHDEDKFDWIIYVLKTFTSLRSLQLNLFSPSYIRKSNISPRQLPECTHRHLTKLEINGFYGSPHEIELLEYLLDNLVELGVLFINPCRKIYKRFNRWDSEVASNSHKIRPEVVEWIHDNVSPTIQLHVL